MNEIRFASHIEKKDINTDNQDDKSFYMGNKKNKRGIFKKVIVLFLIIVTACVSFYGFITFYRHKKIQSSYNQYTAVFLLNGQVYFGILAKEDDKNIVLSKVYYLKNNNTEESSGTAFNNQFSLIKLGSEVHGPTDQLFINRTSILFYEFLRPDSKVLEAIQSSTKL